MGSRVRIAGQGGQGFGGGPPGDLLLTIHVTPHPFFKREGDDLHVDVPITLAEAYRGEKIKISGFGNFVLRDKRQRPGRNPQTGDPIKISERRVLTFIKFHPADDWVAKPGAGTGPPAAGLAVIPACMLR